MPVRVYTTKGLEEQARFALECAHKTVDYFSELFGIEYPLPKSDLLCVHAFVSGTNVFLLESTNIYKGRRCYGELGIGHISYHRGFI